MGKNKALAHHTSTYLHTRRVSIQHSCFRSPTLAGAAFGLAGAPFGLKHAKSHAHPSLRNLKLEHNHAIDREVTAAKMRLAGKLTREMRGQVVNLTGE